MIGNDQHNLPIAFSLGSNITIDRPCRGFRVLHGLVSRSGVAVSVAVGVAVGDAVGVVVGVAVAVAFGDAVGDAVR